MASVLSEKERSLMDAYWRAANYLSVGQIYLYDNPLLSGRSPRSTSSRGCSATGARRPGLNFIYAHLNRVIKKHDLEMIYITGPGHGGPGLVANTYLEGTYSEVYPNIAQDEDGHEAPLHPILVPRRHPEPRRAGDAGSIHEGGELGYALSHAYGAAFDNPDLIVACVVGDGEAETGPLATSWHSNKFLNPATDGAVLPILHLNGYKIANPCCPRPDQPRGARPPVPRLRLHALLRRGRRPGDDAPADGGDARRPSLDEIQRIKTDARGTAHAERPRWPMIVLRTPKGWTCPKEIDGKRTEDYWRSHQVPMGEMHSKPEHVRLLEQWMKSYRPDELFDENGRLQPELADLAPKGERRMSANPARERRAAAARPAAPRLPRLRRRRARTRRHHAARRRGSWAVSCAT